MRHTYDRQADAIYIYLSDQPYAYGHDLGDARRVDFDAAGRPRGIELLNVSDGVDTADLPQRSEVEQLLRRLGLRIYA
jgi:uncharacterized protein YuzE